MLFKVPYADDVDSRPLRVQVDTGSQSVVQQAHKNDVNINTIMHRALKSGVLPSGSRKPMYGDFTGVSFDVMQSQIAEIKNAFSLLPSAIRDRFQQNPSVMLDWLSDPANAEEACKLGLLPEPVKAPVIPDPVIDPVPVPVAAPAAASVVAPSGDKVGA